MSPMIPFWAGLAVALMYLPITEAPSSVLRSAVKTVPVALFALAAWLAAAPLLLVLGLGLSALGDLALSRRGEAAFLAGLGAFALAHVAYVALFLGLSGQPLWAGALAAPLLALGLVALTASTELWLTPHVGHLKGPVRLYVLVITAMGLAALSLPPGAVLLGAALFVGSDVILGYRLFRMAEDHPLLGPVGWAIWSLYIAGQALILSAAA